MPTVQIVTFRLHGLDPEAFAAHCEAVAPVFAELPGLVAKTWLGDADTGVHGGVYHWRDRAAMEAYVAGDTFGALKANPAIADLRTVAYDVLEAPSATTRAPRADDTVAAPA
jgi:hypothetical protein